MLTHTSAARHSAHQDAPTVVRRRLWCGKDELLCLVYSGRLERTPVFRKLRAKGGGREKVRVTFT